MSNIGIAIIMSTVVMVVLGMCTSVQDENGDLKSCRGRVCVVLGIVLSGLISLAIGKVVASICVEPAAGLLLTIGAYVLGAIVAAGIFPLEFLVFVVSAFLRHRDLLEKSYMTTAQDAIKPRPEVAQSEPMVATSVADASCIYGKAAGAEFDHIPAAASIICQPSQAIRGNQLSTSAYNTVRAVDAERSVAQQPRRTVKRGQVISLLPRYVIESKYILVVMALGELILGDRTRCKITASVPAHTTSRVIDTRSRRASNRRIG